MNEGKKFLDSLMNSVKMVGVGAKDVCDKHDKDCSWLLDPLARWSEKAYGEHLRFLGSPSSPNLHPVLQAMIS